MYLASVGKKFEFWWSHLRSPPLLWYPQIVSNFIFALFLLTLKISDGLFGEIPPIFVRFSLFMFLNVFCCGASAYYYYIIIVIISTNSENLIHLVSFNGLKVKILMAPRVGTPHFDTPKFCQILSFFVLSNSENFV